MLFRADDARLSVCAPCRVEMADKGLTRIAIVNPEKCKPKRCRQECKKTCPVVRMGMLRPPRRAIEIEIEIAIAIAHTSRPR